MKFLRETFSRIGRLLAQMSPLQRAPLVILAVAALLFLGAVIVIASRSPRAPLARDLTPEKLEQVARALQELKEPFEVHGGEILVATNRIPGLRKKLIERSIILEDRAFGFEDLVATSGTSPEQRALVARQNELARSVQALDGIVEAQVILKAKADETIPDPAEASGATIRVSTRDRQALRQSTVDAVVDMIVAAVPHATWRDIVVVTTHPPRSYRRADPDDLTAGGNTKFALKRQIEERMSSRIQSYFARLGVTAVASVSVKLNLDRTHREERIIGDPEDKGPRIVKEKRHKQTGKREGVTIDSSQPGGIPAGRDLTEQPATSDLRENEFEYNVVTRDTTEAPGTLDEIRASVVIFDRVTDGQTYDKSIGNSVPEFKKHVANMIGTTEADVEMKYMAYVSKSPPSPPIPPTWPERILASLWATRGVLALFAVSLIALLWVSRRAGAQMAPRAARAEPIAPIGQLSPAGPRGEDVDEGLEHLSGEEKVRELRTRIKRIIERDPRRVGTVLRRWLHRI